MFSLSAWLFRLFQYYGIFLGYTYTYLNIEKRVLKSYIWARVYVYIFNLFCIFSTTKLIIQSLDLFRGNVILFVMDAVTGLAIMLMILYRIYMRFKEERFFKEIFNYFMTLQEKYFKKQENIIANTYVEKLLIFQMLVIMLLTIYKCYCGFLLNNILEFHFLTFPSLLPHYVLWHHVFTLSSINYVIVNLNNALQNITQMEENFPRIYIHTILILQRLNKMYSPIIFCVLWLLLMSHSFFIISLFSFNLPISLIIEIHLFKIISELLEYISIYLYFLICERISRNIKEIDWIILENITKPTNQKVWVINRKISIIYYVF